MAELYKRAGFPEESSAISKAMQRIRAAKAAIDVAEAEAKAARLAAEAADRKCDTALRERLSAENALLTLVNAEPRALIEAD